MKNYKVKKPLSVGGKSYIPDCTIELEESFAISLKDAVEVIKNERDPSKPTSAGDNK